MPQPALRSGGPTRGRRRGSPEIAFTPRKLKLVPLEGFCRIHGPDPLIQVVGTNATPPYVWTDGGVETITDQNTYRAHYAFPDGHFEVSCRCGDGHSSLLVTDTVRCDPNNCRPGRTNFVGAAWTSTHNPTNAADHAPGITDEDVVFGPLCPVAHDINVKLGWTHDTYFLHLRNLVLISTNPLDLTDHCLGLVWQAGGTLDLTEFVDSTFRPFLELIDVRCVSDKDTQEGLLFHHPQSSPRDLRPQIYHVEMRLRDDGRILDSFWLVLNSRVTMLRYEYWVAQNQANLAWVSELPRPTGSIDVTDLAAVSVPQWKSPSACNSFLHHSASYEMRSNRTPGGHGNQACFDADGAIILSGISGGTADKAYAAIENVENHVPEDVEPFLRALQLDGNPGIPNIMNNIHRPCLYEGSCIQDYLICRPITPPE